MSSIPRHLAAQLRLGARAFPAVILTGPRRAGKTTLLRQLFPKAQYRLLEDPDLQHRVRADPREFLRELRPPVILDEIQNVPELFNYIRSIIDEHAARKGQWFLTGSQEAPLMQNVTESMAGRAAVFSLWPMSQYESNRVSLLRGGFPEAFLHPKTISLWFRSYLQTYLERDVRAVSGIRDLSIFRRFMALLASRTGQLLNRTSFASAMSVSVPTISQWLSILEITGQIQLIAPYFENFGKRLVKSPKIHFVDSGLACYLLGIESETQLKQSTFRGSLFEGFVAAEIAKWQQNTGQRREIYYFRDEQGLEVDLVIPRKHRELLLLEVKSSATPRPEMAKSLDQLNRAITGYKTERLLIYDAIPGSPSTHALSPGTRATIIADLHQWLP